MAEKKPRTQKYEFQAEVRQLLDILAHSLYTHRDIFVRELISNASDALEKARFKSIKGEEIADPNLDFKIRITLDKEKKLFTITDTGIGMTREELIKNIGTIARSGSAEFLKQFAGDQNNTLNLIGKFGVGFYSVFMAGNLIEITTRSAIPTESPYLWRSEGTGTYEIKPLDQAPRGTCIKVFLREDAQEFAEKYRIESVIKKYSNFVPFPIFVEDDQVNKISAIWREPRSSVKTEQYNDYYKFLTNRSDEPLTMLHLSADVPIQFHSLLFIPKTNYELMGMGREDAGIHLFVKRILVDSHAKDIMPEYLRFVQGVLDSDDLPLNISRETLQENTVLIKIKNTLVSKLSSHFLELAKNDAAKYNEFWREFGRAFKEGYADYANKEKYVELLRFNSSRSKDADELVSLAEYVDRMKEKQDRIYYLSGLSRAAIEKNPSMEIFKAREIEVLYLYDPVDEFVMTGIFDYRDKKFQSADQANLSDIPSLTSEGSGPETIPAEQKKELETLARRIKDILGDRVEDVRLSERLVASPAALVSPDTTMSAQMQKMMYFLHKDVNIPRKIMELNGRHRLIQHLQAIYQKNPTDPYLTKVVERLFESVLLLDGYLKDPHAMVEGIQELLADSSEMYIQQNKS